MNRKLAKFGQDRMILFRPTQNFELLEKNLFYVVNYFLHIVEDILKSFQQVK